MNRASTVARIAVLLLGLVASTACGISGENLVATLEPVVRSTVEEEARQILRKALSGKMPEKGLASRIHQKVVETTGGLELELPARSQPRPAQDFSGGSA